jgi:RND family efflux transporter MFP subunit
MNQDPRIAASHSDLETSWRPPEAPPEGSAEARAQARLHRRLGLGVSALVIVGLAWGLWQNHAALVASNEAKQAFRDIVPLVRVALVKPAPATADITLPGETLAWRAADIYARANGYVEKRNVDIGDHVKAGDVLAVLSAPELDHQIAQAESTRAQAQAGVRQTDANRELAQVTNARSATLVRQGWVTPQQGDMDRLSLTAQQAALGAAQANDSALDNAIKVLKQQRDYLTVVAPFDGVITQRSLDVGALVQSGATRLFTLQQTDVIRVQVHVPQDQIAGLAPGVEIALRIPESPARAFPGKVSRIAEALEPGARTLLTEAEVPNPDGALKAGAYVRVELKIPRKAGATIIPADALIFNRDGQQVALVENGAAHLRKIAVARDFGTSLEVTAGVAEGDKLILNPTADLVDGQKVRLPEAK